MHKKLIEWHMDQVTTNITEFNRKAEELREYPDSVFVYQQMAKAADRQLANLELQLKNANRELQLKNT